MDINNPIHLCLLYKNSELSDVEFVLQNQDGNQLKIPANRALLALRSSVFRRMFYGELEEGRTVSIVDVSADAFEEFLQLFYLTKVRLTADNISEVLMLVDKYDTSEFWPVCEQFMVKTLSESTAYAYYELSLSAVYNLSWNIKTKAEAILYKNRNLVFGTSGGLNTNALVLSNILKSDKLMGNEVDIFNELMIWAKASAQQRHAEVTADNINDEVSELVKLIRFPVMTIEELTQCFKDHPYLLPLQHMLDLLSFVVNGQPLTEARHYNCTNRVSQREIVKIRFNECEEDNAWQNYITGAFTMQWNGEKSIRYAITLEIYIGETLNTTCSVSVIINDILTFKKSLPLSPSDDTDYKLVTFDDTIVLEPSDNVVITASLDHAVRINQYYTYPEPVDQRTYLTFGKIRNSNIVSAIDLYEI